MEQESLVASVKRLREDIRQQLLELRANLETDAEELRETLKTQEAKRRTSSAREAQGRATNIQEIRDKVRAQLSVDMEIFYAQVQEARANRRMFLFGESQGAPYADGLEEPTEKPKRRASRKRSTSTTTKTTGNKDA